MARCDLAKAQGSVSEPPRGSACSRYIIAKSSTVPSDSPTFSHYSTVYLGTSPHNVYAGRQPLVQQFLILSYGRLHSDSRVLHIFGSSRVSDSRKTDFFCPCAVFYMYRVTAADFGSWAVNVSYRLVFGDTQCLPTSPAYHTRGPVCVRR